MLKHLTDDVWTLQKKKSFFEGSIAVYNNDKRCLLILSSKKEKHQVTTYSCTNQQMLDIKSKIDDQHWCNKIIANMLMISSAFCNYRLTQHAQRRRVFLLLSTFLTSQVSMMSHISPWFARPKPRGDSLQSNGWCMIWHRSCEPCHCFVRSVTTGSGRGPWGSLHSRSSLGNNRTIEPYCDSWPVIFFTRLKMLLIHKDA